MIRQSWKQALGFFMLGVLIWAVLTFGVGFALPNQPLAGKGNCGEGFIYKDSSAPYEYNGDQNICKVKIKAGSQVQGDACFTFKFPPSNQNDGCYNVRGLGSSSVRVGGGGTSNDCKSISHVEFYPCPDAPTDTPRTPPTETPTETTPPPTETRTPKSTSTSTRTPRQPTSTTTTPPSTETETPTETPKQPTPTTDIPKTGTPTDTSIRTITPTSVITPPVETETPSATPPDTLPPPPPIQKTQTPQVLLPKSGVDGREDAAGVEFETAILALISVLVLFIYVVRKNKRDNVS